MMHKCLLDSSRVDDEYLCDDVICFGTHKCRSKQLLNWIDGDHEKLVIRPRKNFAQDTMQRMHSTSDITWPYKTNTVSAVILSHETLEVGQRVCRTQTQLDGRPVQLLHLVSRPIRNKLHIGCYQSFVACAYCGIGKSSPSPNLSAFVCGTRKPSQMVHKDKGARRTLRSP
jgi:hypothetical protein